MPQVQIKNDSGNSQQYVIFAKDPKIYGGQVGRIYTHVIWSSTISPGSMVAVSIGTGISQLVGEYAGSPGPGRSVYISEITKINGSSFETGSVERDTCSGVGVQIDYGDVVALSTFIPKSNSTHNIEMSNTYYVTASSEYRVGEIIDFQMFGAISQVDFTSLLVNVTVVHNANGRFSVQG